MKVKVALEILTEKLNAHLGPKRAKREALEVLAHFLGVSPLNVWLKPEEEIPEDLVQEVLTKRLAGQPLAYILGRAYFFGRPFAIEPGVLIPRPETEVLIEFFLESAPDEGIVLDLGVGSGIIAITLLLEKPNYLAFGVDTNPKALILTKRNAKRHGVEGRLYLMAGDGFNPLRERAIFTAILSNPPYLSEEEYLNLEEEVRLFEPKEALVAGKEGLEFHKMILQEAPRYLTKDGFILLEMGYNQAERMVNLAKTLDYKLEFKKDLLGYLRCVRLWKERGTS